MDIKNLIPKDKGDTETAEKLKNYSYIQLKPIIPELLEWLQDRHWPVAEPVADYLKTICENISSEILDVFETNDLEWKYYIILIFGPIIKDKSIRNIITRIATNPTEQETETELCEVANEVIKNRSWM